MAKKIIGIAGPMASGKGTIAGYFIEKHGATTVRFSEPLFDIANALGLPIDREHLSRISKIVRGEFGQDILAKGLAAKVAKSTSELIVVDGIRRPGDIDAFRRMSGFTFVYIDAPIELRHARMQKRGEKEDDATKTFEDFVKDHEYEAEREVSSLASRASVRIDNSGSLEVLEAQLENLIKA
jgi:dephospho-CoA kinase